MNKEIETIGGALARIPSGCAILTVEHRGQSTGMLVSWVQQASFDPPMITVALKHGRPAARLVGAAERFLLNVIGEDPGALFKQFSRGYALEEDAFAGLSVEPSEFGPLLADGIAHLGCVVRETVAAGDHAVSVAEVQAARFRPEGKPFTHVRKSGLTY